MAPIGFEVPWVIGLRGNAPESPRASPQPAGVASGRIDDADRAQLMAAGRRTSTSTLFKPPVGSDHEILERGLNAAEIGV